MGTEGQREVKFYFDGKEINHGGIPTFTVTDECAEKVKNPLDFNELSFSIK